MFFAAASIFLTQQQANIRNTKFYMIALQSLQMIKRLLEKLFVFLKHCILHCLFCAPAVKVWLITFFQHLISGTSDIVHFLNKLGCFTDKIFQRTVIALHHKSLAHFAQELAISVFVKLIQYNELVYKNTCSRIVAMTIDMLQKSCFHSRIQTPLNRIDFHNLIFKLSKMFTIMHTLDSPTSGNRHRLCNRIAHPFLLIKVGHSVRLVKKWIFMQSVII